MASVHLPNHDLLLRRGHAANVEGLWPAGARAHHGRQRHGAVLHLTCPVELLLQDGGPVGDRQLVTVRWLLMCNVIDTTTVMNNGYFLLWRPTENRHAQTGL